MVAGIAPVARAADPGDLLVEETFTESVVRHPHAIGLGAACLTSATIAPGAGDSNLGICASSVGGPATTADGDGYLQLTDAQGSQVGSVVWDRAVPSSAGLVVEFDQYQYGGNGADGIGFFLSDGSYTLTTTGANGGALGYAQQTWGGVDGLVGGYLGVGLDAFGNFAVDGDWEGRGNGCATPSPYGYVPNAVTLRGPGSGQIGYCVLTSTADDIDGDGAYTSTLPGSLRGTAIGDAERNVRVSVSPDVFPTITVEIDFDGGRDSYVGVLSHVMTEAAPETYKFGFSSSTGGFNDVHLLRNVALSTVDPLAELHLAMTVDNSDPTATKPAYGEGDIVPVKFLVSNTGADTISDVVVAAPGVDGIVCESDTLGAAGSPTAHMICTGTATVTDAHVKSPQLTLSGTATGTSTFTGAVMDTDGMTVDLVQVPAMTVVGVATLASDVNADGSAGPGDTLTYSYTVTNTGDVTLTGLALTDSLGGAVTCAATSLNPGDTTTCTPAGDYTVTEGDASTGSVTDSVTGSASVPVGVSALTPVTETTVTPAVGTAALSLDVSAAIVADDGDGKANPGEDIAYTYTVTNLGDVALSGLTLGSSRGLTPSCAASSLAAGASTTCTATTTATVSDAVAGAVTESATADATAPGSVADPAQASDSASTQAVSVPSFTVDGAAVLTGDLDADGMVSPGDELTYTYLVTNTGDVALSGIAIADSLGGAVTCAPAALNPGDSVTCTAASVYTVLESDVAAGQVEDVVTGSAVTAAGLPDPIDVSETTTTPTHGTAALTVSVTPALADANGDGKANTGETISYTYTVLNIGAVTVSDVTVVGALGGAATCAAGPLAPGASVVCVGSQSATVTRAQATAGSVVEAVTANATSPGVVDDPAEAVAGASTPAVRIAGLTLTSVAILSRDANGDGKAGPGDLLSFAYRLTNAGEATLTGVAITGSLGGRVACAATSLAPGASTLCVGIDRRTVTQDDAVAASIVDSVAAVATVPVGVAPLAPVPGMTSTAVNARVAIALVSTPRLVDANGDGKANLGEKVTFRYRVTNDSDVTLTNIGVTGSLGGKVTCGASTLAPGEETVCDAAVPYTITTADILAGRIADRVVGTGDAPAPLGAALAEAHEVEETVAEALPAESTPELAMTGAESGLLAWAAAVLALAGVGTLMVARRNV